jgi:hypothetical protein
VISEDLADSKTVKAMSGLLFSKQVVTLRDIHTPKFDKNQQIAQQ